MVLVRSSLPSGWLAKSGFLIGPGADLSETNVPWADFTGVDFTGVDISGVEWGIMGGGPDLTGADLSGAIVTSPPTYLVADLTDTNLSGLDLSNTSFGSYWAAPAAVFVGTIIEGTDFSDADLSGGPYADIVSSGLIGTPAALPACTAIVDGSFSFGCAAGS